jgi:hypothetical protein
MPPTYASPRMTDQWHGSEPQRGTPLIQLWSSRSNRTTEGITTPPARTRRYRRRTPPKHIEHLYPHPRCDTRCRNGGEHRDVTYRTCEATTRGVHGEVWSAVVQIAPVSNSRWPRLPRAPELPYAPPTSPAFCPGSFCAASLMARAKTNHDSTLLPATMGWGGHDVAQMDGERGYRLDALRLGARYLCAMEYGHNGRAEIRTAKNMLVLFRRGEGSDTAGPTWRWDRARMFKAVRGWPAAPQVGGRHAVRAECLGLGRMGGRKRDGLGPISKLTPLFFYFSFIFVQFKPNSSRLWISKLIRMHKQNVSMRWRYLYYFLLIHLLSYLGNYFQICNVYM